jgi:MFS transporter, OPA family, sugar phosphate sensor protein UhpC
MFTAIARFFKTGPDAPPLQLSKEEIKKKYDYRRWSVFFGIWVGYGIFYVNRLGFSVVKKPIIDSGLLNADQLGKIGAVTLIGYAVGKFFNGVLADSCNIRKFLSIGLMITALINLAVGFTSLFWAFLVLWGVNGWFQATGCGPCVVTMSQWFGKKERGTLYGVWSAAHAIGEIFSFVCFSLIVSYFGWRAGFGSAAIVGLIMAAGLVFLLSDRPETYGLPNIKEYKNEKVEEVCGEPVSLLKQQVQIMVYPAIWVVAIASAMNYVTRYGINSWGILYLQETKHYSLVAAGATLGINSFAGMGGAAFCGFFSDRFFKSNRLKPMFIYGLLQLVSLLGFFYAPAELKWLNTLCIGVYGFAMGGTLAFLGGLIAIDLVPRRVAGAAMGFVGLISYIGASAQDLLSGHLLQKTAVKVAGVTTHNFDAAILVWVGASVLSLLLLLTIWNVKSCED